MNRRRQNAMTLMELIVAMTIIVVIMSVLLPQFRVMYRSFDLRQASAETLQGAAVFTSHFQQMLAQATAITAVSDSSNTSGYIEFTATDGLTYRYDLSGGNIRYGLQAGPQYMAGPVSSLTFTCYQQSNLTTPVTTPSLVDYIKVDAMFTDSTGYSQTQSVTANAALARTHVSTGGTLVLHLKMNETSGSTANDSSGNNFHGTLVNMGSMPWSAGHINNCLYLNNSDLNDVVVVNDNSLLRLSTAGTLAAWVKIPASMPYEWGGIIHKGVMDDFSDTSYSLYIEGQYPSFMVSGTGPGISAIYISASELSLNTWYHIAGSWNSSGVYLYVNGALAMSGSPGLTARTNNADVHIGAILNEYPDSYYGIYPYKGYMDDVRIYNYKLSSSEIAGLAGM